MHPSVPGSGSHLLSDKCGERYRGPICRQPGQRRRKALHDRAVEHCGLERVLALLAQDQVIPEHGPQRCLECLRRFGDTQGGDGHGLQIVDDVLRGLFRDPLGATNFHPGPKRVEHHFGSGGLKELPAWWCACLDAQALDQFQLFGGNQEDVGSRPNLELGQRRKAAGFRQAVGRISGEVLLPYPVIEIRGFQGVDVRWCFDPGQDFIKQQKILPAQRLQALKPLFRKAREIVAPESHQAL